MKTRKYTIYIQKPNDKLWNVLSQSLDKKYPLFLKFYFKFFIVIYYTRCVNIIPLEKDIIYEILASTVLCCMLTIFQIRFITFISTISFNPVILKEI